MISKQIEKDLSKSSLIRKMFEEGKRLKALYGAENVYDFSLGNPALNPPDELLNSLVKHAPEPGVHRYMLNAGYEDVREKVAAHHSKTTDTQLTKHNIIMTVGAAGGLNVALKALLNPSDEVIILAPYFVDYLFYIKNYQGTPVIVQTKPDSFQLDIDNIASALTPKTKAIIINSPNNPTGVIYPQEDLEKLAKVLNDFEEANGINIAIISDEPYNQLNYELPVPNLLNIFDNAIVINSFSKSLSLPGGRIGYIIVSPKIADLNLVVGAIVFATRTLGFVNAPAIYQKAIADVLDLPSNKAHYKKMRDALLEIVRGAGFECIEPDGAFYLFVKSPIADDMEFSSAAAKHNILLVPGSGFGCPGYFRLTYCGEMNTILNSKEAFLKLGQEFNLI